MTSPREVSGTVLIAGGSGLLGKCLVRRFSSKTAVISVSKNGRDSTQAVDLSSQASVEALFSGRRFSLVIHAAATSDVDGCERDPEAAYRTNALSAKYLAQACRKHATPFLYVSTDYVFDGRKKTPYETGDPVCPVNAYGLTKLAGEHFARMAGISAIVRTSWLFGDSPGPNFVKAITERMEKEPVVRVLDDQEDAPTYAEDLAEAIEKIAAYLVEQAGRAGGFRDIFQVRNAGSATRLSMALRIRQLLGREDVRVERLDARLLANRVAIRPRYGVLSLRRYEETFGCRMRPWEEALGDYIRGRKKCAS